MARLLAALMMFALLIPVPASAGNFLENATQFKKPNLKWGQLEIHPYYRFSETYDSNIYMTPKSPSSGGPRFTGDTLGPVKGAMVTENNLGIAFKLPITGMHAVDGLYDLQSLIYSKDGGSNNRANQKVNVGYQYKGPMGLSGNAYNKYMNTNDPAVSEDARKEARWQNSLGGGGEYAPGGKLYAAVSLDHTRHKYVNDNVGQSQNRYEQTFGLKGGYKIAPKTKAYIGWRRQIIHYSESSNTKNNKSHFLDFGVEGSLAPKLQGSIQTGVQLKDYDSDSNGTITGYTRNWIVASMLNYKPQDRCTFNLGVSRSLQEASFGTNRFYISNAVTLGYSHKFPYKLTGTLDLGFTVDRYPESSTVGSDTRNRRDDIYSQKIGVDYGVQEYLSIGASYAHRQKFSVFSGNYNYDDHQTGLNIKLTF